MTTAAIEGIGQIAITVKDVAAAKKFYAEILGLKPLFDAGPNLSSVAAGPVRLMLTTAQGAGEPGKNSTLYFRTGSVDTLYRTLIDRGAHAERAPQLTAKMPDHELWMAFIRDPEGNLVGLMEERR